MTEMNVILTVNKKFQAMILHDMRLGFEPSWVEFSPDKRGIRIISEDGEEFSAGVVLKDIEIKQLDDVHDVVILWMQDQKPQEGFEVPFINQNYERKGKRRNYSGGWSKEHDAAGKQ